METVKMIDEELQMSKTSEDNTLANESAEIAKEPETEEDIEERERSEFLKEKMTEITNKINVIERKLKRMNKDFKGFESRHKGYKTEDELEQEQSEMTNQQKKDLYDAVAYGDIKQVEDLLDMPHADINMTWFSENLLMCAIRNQREKMAEYLINRGIDVTYVVDFMEFKNSKKPPVNYYFYTCRDMAYDHGMNNIVRLIDIFHEKTDERVVKYLGKRFIRDNAGNLDISETAPLSLYEKRLQAESRVKIDKMRLLSEDAKLLLEQKQKNPNFIADEEGSNHSFESVESNYLYETADKVKPPSLVNAFGNETNRVRFSTPNSLIMSHAKSKAGTNKRSIHESSNNNFERSSEDFFSMSTQSLFVPSKHLLGEDSQVNQAKACKMENDLNVNIARRISNLKVTRYEYESEDVQEDTKKSPIFQKRLKYEGYDINFNIYRGDSPLPKDVTSPRIQVVNKQQRAKKENLVARLPVQNKGKVTNDLINTGTEVRVKDVAYFSEEETDSDDQSIAPFSLVNLKPSKLKKPQAPKVPKETSKAAASSKAEASVSMPKIEKSEEKPKRRPRPVAPKTNESVMFFNDSTYRKPVYAADPANDSSSTKKRETINPPIITSQIEVKPQQEFTAKLGDKRQPESKPTIRKFGAHYEVKMNKEKIMQTYLSSLKKSGLINKNCQPIIKEKKKSSYSTTTSYFQKLNT